MQTSWRKHFIVRILCFLLTVFYCLDSSAENSYAEEIQNLVGKIAHLINRNVLNNQNPEVKNSSVPLLKFQDSTTDLNFCESLQPYISFSEWLSQELTMNQTIHFPNGVDDEMPIKLIITLNLVKNIMRVSVLESGELVLIEKTKIFSNKVSYTRLAGFESIKLTSRNDITPREQELCQIYHWKDLSKNSNLKAIIKSIDREVAWVLYHLVKPKEGDTFWQAHTLNE